jgi:hypothetical protein
LEGKEKRFLFFLFLWERAMPTVTDLNNLISELERLARQYARNRPEPEAFTIADFCAMTGMSKSSYQKLQKRGLGPKVVRLVGMPKKRITKEDFAAWKKQMAELRREQAADIEAEQTALVETRRAAGRASAASPKHISKQKKRRAPVAAGALEKQTPTPMVQKGARLSDDPTRRRNTK